MTNLCFILEKMSKFLVSFCWSWGFIKNQIKIIDVDIETEIFNGFKIHNLNLGHLICVGQLRKRNEEKTLKLLKKSNQITALILKSKKDILKSILRVWISRSLWLMWFQFQTGIFVADVGGFNSRLFQMVFSEQKEFIRRYHRVRTK